MAVWWWVAFGVLVGLMLALDLMVFHRHSAREGAHRSLLWSGIWVGIGLAFSLVVGFARGHDASLAYITAYLVELSLSVDNLFVFLALFTYFSVVPEHQHRVLFWGVLGAIVFRAAFIFAGVQLISRFHWMMYVLGVILIATGAKLGLSDNESVHPERNLAVRWVSRIVPLEKRFHGERFTARTPSGLRFTPLLLVLVAIESTDIMFAVDSVPAALGVSRDAFVVYTSNILAVLGLRALYFVLAHALRSLRLLQPALALVLGLIGVKMLLSEVIEVPTVLTLAGVAVILAAATAGSILLPEKRKRGQGAG